MANKYTQYQYFQTCLSKFNSGANKVSTSNRSESYYVSLSNAEKATSALMQALPLVKKVEIISNATYYS